MALATLALLALVAIALWWWLRSEPIGPPIEQVLAADTAAYLVYDVGPGDPGTRELLAELETVLARQAPSPLPALLRGRTEQLLPLRLILLLGAPTADEGRPLGAILSCPRLGRLLDLMPQPDDCLSHRGCAIRRLSGEHGFLTSLGGRLLWSDRLHELRRLIDRLLQPRPRGPEHPESRLARGFAPAGPGRLVLANDGKPFVVGGAGGASTRLQLPRDFLGAILGLELDNGTLIARGRLRFASAAGRAAQRPLLDSLVDQLARSPSTSLELRERDANDLEVRLELDLREWLNHEPPPPAGP